MNIDIPEAARLVGRVWRPEHKGPSIVIVREGSLYDVTADIATVADLLDADSVALFDELKGELLGPVTDFLAEPAEMKNGANRACLIAPCDLQALKACGVTFARSMIERVIDERTAGDSERADAIRQRIGNLIGGSLTNVRAGSEAAEEVRRVLQREGLWSQYLEVGIGPDAEVFTKGQPLSAVGHGAYVGVNKISNWNNPEPEIVLAVNGKGEIRGATLGNDVNLRDVEGRSALLLGKAKDNNASAALGPFIRLFDDGFTIDSVRTMEVALEVKGEDGFVLTGHSSMSQISRTPESLVAAALGEHHQYPDGLVLYLGTMFAPVQDRDGAGKGFTHKLGDVVTISSQALGALVNTVNLSSRCPPWTYGARSLMTDLARAGLL